VPSCISYRICATKQHCLQKSEMNSLRGLQKLRKRPDIKGSCVYRCTRMGVFLPRRLAWNGKS